MTKKDSDIDRKSKIIQLARLKAKNDLARQKEQMAEGLIDTMGVMQNGGNIKKMEPGGNKTGPMAPEDPLQDYVFPWTDEVDPEDLQFDFTDPTVTTNKSKSIDPNAIAAGLKGASLLGSAVDALRKPEQEQLQLPDYSKGNQYMQNMSMDFAPQLAEINRAATKGIQDTSNQVSSIGQRSSRVAGILARAGQGAASAQLAQQQANNRTKSILGQRADRQSEVTAQERIRQQDIQSRNDVTAKLAGRKFMQDLSKVGSTVSQMKFAKDQMENMNDIQRKNTAYGLYMLAMKNPNFKPSPALIEAIQQKNPDPSKIVSLIEFVD